MSRIIQAGRYAWEWFAELGKDWGYNSQYVKSVGVMTEVIMTSCGTLQIANRMIDKSIKKN